MQKHLPQPLYKASELGVHKLQDLSNEIFFALAPNGTSEFQARNLINMLSKKKLCSTSNFLRQKLEVEHKKIDLAPSGAFELQVQNLTNIKSAIFFAFNL
jgi:hypothetical protein